MTIFSRFAAIALLATAMIAPTMAGDLNAWNAHTASRRRHHHHLNHSHHHQAKEHHAHKEHEKNHHTHKEHHHSKMELAHVNRHHSFHHEAQGSGCKTGLGWTDNSVNQKPFQQGSCWCYNWSPWKCSSALESVPMLWGMKQIGDWDSQVVGKHWNYILAFNEPEQRGQSNMDPKNAAVLWRKHIQPVNAQGKGSPAVTTSPAGKQWITTFLKECNDCQIDFVCLHYYGTTSQNFKELILEFYTAVGKPIWVTEWACQDYSGKNHQCSDAQTKQFLQETKAWMDAQPWIHRYAYYGAFTNINIDPSNRLMDDKGHITSLGRMYLG